MEVEYPAQMAHKREDSLVLRHKARDQCIALHPDQGKQDVRRKCLPKVMLKWHLLKAMTRTT